MKNTVMVTVRSEEESWQLLEIGPKEGCSESSMQEAVGWSLKLPGLVTFSDLQRETGDVRRILNKHSPLNPMRVHGVFQVSLFMLASQQNV
jgi:hypothetical protein